MRRTVSGGARRSARRPTSRPTVSPPPACARRARFLLLPEAAAEDRAAHALAADHVIVVAGIGDAGHLAVDDADQGMSSRSRCRPPRCRRR